MAKNIREIVFDTETTGFNFGGGDRMVEIGALELINHIPTGKTFHELMNPERPIPFAATNVHKITDDMVAHKPLFKDIAQKWLDFIGEDSVLVAHNATFDMNFLNMEFKKIGMPTIGNERVVDTLQIARQKFPSAKASLDALCRKFDISLERRNSEGHGALLDSEILTEVYIELLGGKEMSFLEEEKEVMTVQGGIEDLSSLSNKKIERRSFPISDEEQKKHSDFVETLGDESVWKKVSS